MGTRPVASPTSFGQGKLAQRQWRTAGAASLAVAALMAVYAVSSGFLRESVLHAVDIVPGQSPTGVDPTGSIFFHLVYWIAFGILVLTCFYCALLDLRYIRYLYAVERRDIFSRTLGDPGFRESLIRGPGKDGNSGPAESKQPER